MPSTKVLAVIPARYGSKRFPGKPLAPISGVPMIVRVLRRVERIRGIDRVVVATDDERIRDVVVSAGGEAMMTSKTHRSGTSRSAEAAAAFRHGLVLNVQGDEPLLPVAGVERLIAAMKAEKNLVMGTLAARSTDPEAAARRDVVKLVRSREGMALYFSRSPVPSRLRPLSSPHRRLSLQALISARLRFAPPRPPGEEGGSRAAPGPGKRLRDQGDRVRRKKSRRRPARGYKKG